MADANPSGKGRNQAPTKKPAKPNGIVRNERGQLVKRETVTQPHGGTIVVESAVFEGDYNDPAKEAAESEGGEE